MLRIGIALSAFLYCATALAADEELLDVVAQKLDDSSDSRIAAQLDQSAAPDQSLPNARNLKKLSAFGVVFAGRAKIEGDEVTTLSYWTDDSNLSVPVVEATFKTIAAKLQQQHGPAKIADVPNFDDGPLSYRVFRWHVADEVILLSLHIRAQYASLDVVRTNQTAWLADMGAGEHEFWEKTLKSSKE